MSQDATGMPPVPDPSTQDSEPLAFVGGLTTLVAAVLSALIAFGVPLGESQRAALVAVIAVAAPLVTTFVGRSKVWSPKTVAELLTLVDPGYARTGSITVTPSGPTTPPPGPAAGPPFAA